MTTCMGKVHSDEILLFYPAAVIFGGVHSFLNLCGGGLAFLCTWELRPRAYLVGVNETE